MPTKKAKPNNHSCIQCGKELGHQCMSQFCTNCEPEPKPLQAEIIPYPLPKGTYEERVEALMKSHPKLSEKEAGRYLTMQAAGEVSSVFSSSDGGGRFGNYYRKLKKEGKL